MEANELEPQARSMEWRRAWTALRALIDDPKRTDQVFEIIEALAGQSFERSFQRFTASREGRRLLVERPSLLAALSDREALRAMPDGSFGRAYLAFMESGGLTAEGLVEADEIAAERSPHQAPQLDPDRQYVGDRTRDMHDLWHVLTGYGMDEAGEAANLAFTFGQIPSLGFALIVGAAAILGPPSLTLWWQRYLVHAWQRGRNARNLVAAPYEELLPRPLAEVRDRLAIEPPEVAHPDGIIVASRDDIANPLLTRQQGAAA